MRPSLACLLLLTLVACGKVEEPGADPGLIDDLEDGDDAIEPLEARIGYWYINHDESDGSLMPGPDFAPTIGGVDDSAYCAGVAGRGFTGWGVKLGVTLQQAQPDVIASPYDISSRTGIAFRARGNVGIDVVVPTPAALEIAHGGECVPGATVACNDFHGQPVALAGEWREYQLPLASLQQEGWGLAVPFDPMRALAIEFEIDAGLTFDICVDDLRFY
jgi:hypothetical protein